MFGKEPHNKVLLSNEQIEKIKNDNRSFYAISKEYKIHRERIKKIKGIL